MSATVSSLSPDKPKEERRRQGHGRVTECNAQESHPPRLENRPSPHTHRMLRPKLCDRARPLHRRVLRGRRVVETLQHRGVLAGRGRRPVAVVPSGPLLPTEDCVEVVVGLSLRALLARNELSRPHPTCLVFTSSHNECQYLTEDEGGTFSTRSSGAAPLETRDAFGVYSTTAPPPCRGGRTVALSSASNIVATQGSDI